MQSTLGRILKASPVLGQPEWAHDNLQPTSHQASLMLRNYQEHPTLPNKWGHHIHTACWLLLLPAKLYITLAFMLCVMENQWYNHIWDRVSAHNLFWNGHWLGWPARQEQDISHGCFLSIIWIQMGSKNNCRRSMEFLQAHLQCPLPTCSKDSSREAGAAQKGQTQT